MWNNPLIYANARPESELAIAEGLRIAAFAGGTATVMDVLAPPPAYFLPNSSRAAVQRELSRLMLDHRREQLASELPVVHEKRAKVRTSMGQPAFELIRQTVRGLHDLVVKSARGRDLRHMTSFGTTALHLVRKSPVPVLLVGQQQRLRVRSRVLCALDLEEGEARSRYNAALLSAAHTLARVYGAELHIAHVIDTLGAGSYQRFLSAEAFARIEEERRGAARDVLEQQVSWALPGVTGVTVHLLEGKPSDSIVDLSARLEASHLVLGSVGQSAPGLFIGSIAEDVLSQVECSVLTLKPTGFITPVQALDQASASERGGELAAGGAY